MAQPSEAKECLSRLLTIDGKESPHDKDGKEPRERYAIESGPHPEDLQSPTTWFEVTRANSTFQLEQSLSTLAASANPT